jgi:hypothetical protein
LVVMQIGKAKDLSAPLRTHSYISFLISFMLINILFDVSLLTIILKYLNVELDWNMIMNIGSCGCGRRLLDHIGRECPIRGLERPRRASKDMNHDRRIESWIVTLTSSCMVKDEEALLVRIVANTRKFNSTSRVL